MKHIFHIPFIILFVVFSYLPLHSQQSFPLKKDIVVREDEVQKSVVTFGGSVRIEGKAKSVIAFGGTVTVRGEVTDLFCIGSNIKLESPAVIKGDVFALGGTFDKEPGCDIQGDTVHFETSDNVSRILRQAFRNVFSVSFIPLIMIGKLIIFFIWFLLSLVVVAVFPNQISAASSHIRKSFWPSFAVGLLGIIIFVGVVIFSALLSFFLIGIPLLFFFVILGIAIQIFSRVVLFSFFGESSLKAFGKPKASLLVFVIIGLVLVTVIRFIPVIGFLFSLCLSIISWGAVIMTRFGSSGNWFRKRA